MRNFNYFQRRLRQILSNLYFFATLGKLPSTRPALQMDITGKCNLRCKGCYHFSSPPAPDLSDEELLAFLFKKKQEGYKKLWVFGGEPTLRANLFDQIDRWFVEIQVISNGLIKIDPKYPWKLWISLDGPREVSDAIRGKGTFDTVIKNYQGDKRTGLVMTVNRSNYQHIPYMIELVKAIGVKTVSFTFYSRCKDDLRTDFDFTPEDLRNIEKILSEELKKNSKYMLLDPATLKSLLYGKVSHPRWNNRCFFASVLIDSFNCSGKSRKCCVENVICDTCRILPPHQFHSLMVSKKAPWYTYIAK